MLYDCITGAEDDLSPPHVNLFLPLQMFVSGTEERAKLHLLFVGLHTITRNINKVLHNISGTERKKQSGPEIYFGMSG